MRQLINLDVIDWFAVGEGLGFSHEQLTAIGKKSRNNDKICKMKVLGRWMRKMEPKDHTQLMEALSHAKENHAISQLQRRYG